MTTHEAGPEEIGALWHVAEDFEPVGGEIAGGGGEPAATRRPEEPSDKRCLFNCSIRNLTGTKLKFAFVKHTVGQTVEMFGAREMPNGTQTMEQFYMSCAAVTGDDWWLAAISDKGDFFVYRKKWCNITMDDSGRTVFIDFRPQTEGFVIQPPLSSSCSGSYESANATDPSPPPLRVAEEADADIAAGAEVGTGTAAAAQLLCVVENATGERLKFVCVMRENGDSLTTFTNYYEMLPGAELGFTIPDNQRWNDFWSVYAITVTGHILFRERALCSVTPEDVLNGPIKIRLRRHRLGFDIEMPRSEGCPARRYA